MISLFKKSKYYLFTVSKNNQTSALSYFFCNKKQFISDIKETIEQEVYFNEIDINERLQELYFENEKIITGVIRTSQACRDYRKAKYKEKKREKVVWAIDQAEVRTYWAYDGEKPDTLQLEIEKGTLFIGQNRAESVDLMKQCYQDNAGFYEQCKVVTAFSNMGEVVTYRL